MATELLERKAMSKAPVRSRRTGRIPMIFDELEGLWSSLMGQPFPFAPISRGEGWIPSVDVFEKEGHLVIQMDLPGMKKEDIDVSLEQNALLVRGERKSESETKEENFYRMERTAGSFYRAIPLPFEVTQNDVEAQFKDGVLEVRVPKPPEERPEAKRITVK